MGLNSLLKKERANLDLERDYIIDFYNELSKKLVSEIISETCSKIEQSLKEITADFECNSEFIKSLLMKNIDSGTSINDIVCRTSSKNVSELIGKKLNIIYDESIDDRVFDISFRGVNKTIDIECLENEIIRELRVCKQKNLATLEQIIMKK
ncbi:MAG: hypothetical protein ACRC4M_05480 [Mycoplasma sp.]